MYVYDNISDYYLASFVLNLWANGPMNNTKCIIPYKVSQVLKVVNFLVFVYGIAIDSVNFTQFLPNDI